MKLSSSTMLLAAFLAAGMASAQTPDTPGVSYRTLGTSGPDASNAAPGSGASGSANGNGAGAPSGMPDSTGSAGTPGTSAAGPAVDCPPAVGRADKRAGGSTGMASSTNLSGPATPATGADCAAAGPGGPSSGDGTSGTSAAGGAPGAAAVNGVAPLENTGNAPRGTGSEAGKGLGR